MLGLLAVADTVRPEARQAVELLQQRRIQVVMLSSRTVIITWDF